VLGGAGRWKAVGDGGRCWEVMRCGGRWLVVVVGGRRLWRWWVLGGRGRWEEVGGVRR
jgi:hypothetical protein